MRLVSLFGQKTQEHVKTIEKRCLEAKNDNFREKYILNKVGFRSILHVSDPKLTFWENSQMILLGFVRGEAQQT